MNCIGRIRKAKESHLITISPTKALHTTMTTFHTKSSLTGKDFFFGDREHQVVELLPNIVFFCVKDHFQLSVLVNFYKKMMIPWDAIHLCRPRVKRIEPSTLTKIQSMNGKCKQKKGSSVCHSTHMFHVNPIA
jgi:hypothetical protein